MKTYNEKAEDFTDAMFNFEGLNVYNPNEPDSCSNCPRVHTGKPCDFDETRIKCSILS